MDSVEGNALHAIQVTIRAGTEVKSLVGGTSGGAGIGERRAKISSFTVTSENRPTPGEWFRGDARDMV
ncbi:hypothetical protein LX12_004333 [Williamsia serinedens]|uniref:Uncharacterized protein n=1 Tax=Williamsia serinedens TaxID=391736 RepID=A0ABT1H874_9NOCA|nr:hypothetical protein [Williamsia serinedens]